MQIVIDISEEDYNKLLNGEGSINLFLTLCAVVLNGIPLPKGHRRLIDADAFIATMEDASKRQKYKELLIDDSLTVDDVFKAIIESLQNKGLAEGDSPIIIEADKRRVGMTLEEEIKRFTDNAEYERTHGNLQGCLEFKQLADWLKDYKRLLEQEPILDKIKEEIKDNTYFINETTEKEGIDFETVEKIIDKYKAENEDKECQK